MHELYQDISVTIDKVRFELLVIFLQDSIRYLHQLEMRYYLHWVIRRWLCQVSLYYRNVVKNKVNNKAL